MATYLTNIKNRNIWITVAPMLVQRAQQGDLVEGGFVAHFRAETDTTLDGFIVMGETIKDENKKPKLFHGETEAFNAAVAEATKRLP